MTKITQCPPAKAYGYDRETLNKRDKEIHDWRTADDHSRTVNGKRRAAIIPSGGIDIEPRDYSGEPT